MLLVPLELIHEGFGDDGILESRCPNILQIIVCCISEIQTYLGVLLSAWQPHLELLGTSQWVCRPAQV